MGIIDKDESKTADMVEIMDIYQRYVPQKPDGSPFILPLYADGLSCERGNDAQSARINGTTPWTQLQGMKPSIQEWHKRVLLLQVGIRQKKKCVFTVYRLTLIFWP